MVNRKCNYQFTKSKPSPSDIKYPNLSPKKKRSLNCAKRSSPSASSVLSGSMTVEAAMVLPLFLFFLLNLLFYIEIFRLHSVFAMALRETGNTMAVYGHIYDKLDIKEDGEAEQLIENVGFSYLYVKNDVIHQLSKEYLEQSPLTGGTAGMNFLQSKIMDEDDRIELVLTYRVSPLIDIGGFSSFYMVNRYYGRAFTGYELTPSESVQAEQVVYLAENGKVYHSSLNCTHLKLSIRQVSLEEVAFLRNEKGEKYTACSVCGRSIRNSIIYITGQGDKYHGSIDCSGLKRTITAIPISQADKFPMCSRCQK